MSRLEKTNIRIKYSKVKKLEKICFYFCEDYTAMDTSKKLGISRQTINHYYKILRERLNSIFLPFDTGIIHELLQGTHLHIQHAKSYNHSVFFMESKGRIFILENHKDMKPLFTFFEKNIKESLCNHKKANCARILFNSKNQSFLLSGYFKESDKFDAFLHHRLKQFRGVSKEKMRDYFKESQIRYNFHAEVLYTQLIQSFVQH